MSMSFCPSSWICRHDEVRELLWNGEVVMMMICKISFGVVELIYLEHTRKDGIKSLLTSSSIDLLVVGGTN
jgi:hypothetical protein